MVAPLKLVWTNVAPSNSVLSEYVVIAPVWDH
jgi:hypothetical protein